MRGFDAVKWEELLKEHTGIMREYIKLKRNIQRRSNLGIYIYIYMLGFAKTSNTLSLHIISLVKDVKYEEAEKLIEGKLRRIRES